MGDEKDNSKGFKVEDKRRFTQEGEAKEGSPTEAKREPTSQPRPSEKLPPIDFTVFVLSLASSVQVHLGLVANPGSQKIEKNLSLAQQTIDILGLLQEKTKGNLTPEEGQVLQSVLSDLRLQYVEAKK